jgi:hypothetical protein
VDMQQQALQNILIDLTDGTLDVEDINLQTA